MDNAATKHETCAMDLLISSVLASVIWVVGSSVALLLAVLMIDDPDRRNVRRDPPPTKDFQKSRVR